MTNLIEYKVRPVTRFIVTRFHSEDEGDGRGSAGSESLGEFDNFYKAHKVAQAVASEEHRSLGGRCSVAGDVDFRFPAELSEAEAVAAHERETQEAHDAWERFRDSPEYNKGA